MNETPPNPNHGPANIMRGGGGQCTVVGSREGRQPPVPRIPRAPIRPSEQRR